MDRGRYRRSCCRTGRVVGEAWFAEILKEAKALLDEFARLTTNFETAF